MRQLSWSYWARRDGHFYCVWEMHCFGCRGFTSMLLRCGLVKRGIAGLHFGGAFSLRAEKQHGLIRVAYSFTKARKAAHPKILSLGSANLNRGSKRAAHKTDCC